MLAASSKQQQAASSKQAASKQQASRSKQATELISAYLHISVGRDWISPKLSWQIGLMMPYKHTKFQVKSRQGAGLVSKRNREKNREKNHKKNAKKIAKKNSNCEKIAKKSLEPCACARHAGH